MLGVRRRGPIAFFDKHAKLASEREGEDAERDADRRPGTKGERS
jgi:hypothetical protein